ncbi:hypothetical protein Ppa06_36700 [Planomonospora parontospora subsp. parontospora]|uniref:Uncharacterized protein n=2 Tax=Planomonospora parontospora TaxID=58119 RepID=A0AA37BGZ5_9ACTN|nr:hypothetical protein GCM10010126_31740 [Planomonospora parontospora]GII09872.1 hypothetical protein Ppa06_36700 [Planomonospora parontospora subsp. parontospora]
MRTTGILVISFSSDFSAVFSIALCDAVERSSERLFGVAYAERTADGRSLGQGRMDLVDQVIAVLMEEMGFEDVRLLHRRGEFPGHMGGFL